VPIAAKRADAPCVGAVVAQPHQLLRMADRQRPQQCLIEQRENGGVGADAQRQREHRHQCKTGRLQQLTDSVTKVEKNGVHNFQFRVSSFKFPISGFEHPRTPALSAVFWTADFRG